MKQPLLSVIVPCYNLEQYIDKCLSSIVGQTYSNLEILLINDGSSDNTGAICDAWQKRDQRIRVIHKQNEGLSYARKTGIEKATADYVTFVDVDDWIDRNMYTDMMTALLSTNSDIAQCEFCKVFEDGRIEYRNQEHKTGSVEIVGREEGVILILDDKKWNSVMWNKIFKKCLFDHVVFYNNYNLGEDFIAHDLFHQASQTVFLADTYYFYFQREDSMLRARTVASRMRSQYQFAVAAYDRYLFTKKYPQYHRMLQDMKERAMVEGVISLRDMMAYPQHTPDGWFQSQTKRLRAIPLTGREGISFGFKLDIFLVKIHPKLYQLVRKLYVYFKNVQKK